jgi:hypothetical protein
MPEKKKANVRVRQQWRKAKMANEQEDAEVELRASGNNR